jgi:hypothetical protein
VRGIADLPKAISSCAARRAMTVPWTTQVQQTHRPVPSGARQAELCFPPPPADHAPLDELTRARVPQALGRALTREQQQVGADVILAQRARVTIGVSRCPALCGRGADHDTVDATRPADCARHLDRQLRLLAAVGSGEARAEPRMGDPAKHSTWMGSHADQSSEPLRPFSSRTNSCKS